MRLFPFPVHICLNQQPQRLHQKGGTESTKMISQIHFSATFHINQCSKVLSTGNFRSVKYEIPSTKLGLNPTNTVTNHGMQIQFSQIQTHIKRMYFKSLYRFERWMKKIKIITWMKLLGVSRPLSPSKSE